MKLRIGQVPANPDFDPAVGSWRSLKEPSAAWAQLMALPVGLAVTFLLLVLWLRLTPVQRFELPPFLVLMAALLISFIIHELIHFFTFPRQGRGAHAILGFWPSKMVFYAHYDEELPRNRFLLVLITPFLVLSILPLLCCAVFGLFSSYLMLLSLLNALASCVDLLGFAVILWQVPKTAAIRNQGWKSYYRTQAAEAEKQASEIETK